MSTTFRALHESPNFRRYYLGQSISLAGSWMQMVAQGWLVLELTGSAAQIGLVAAMQTMPVLLLSIPAGVLIDRYDTRKLLLISQLMACVPAVLLGVLTLTHHVHIWMVYVLAAGLGLSSCIENPSRSTLATELVGPELLTNAITLNSININVARVVGPSLAAGTIAVFGLGTCFLANGISYLAVVFAITRVRSDQLFPRRREPHHRGQTMEGLRYVWNTPALRLALSMMAVVGTLTYEFTVSIPALAKGTFHGGASLYGLFTGSLGAGAVIGGLIAAGRPRYGVAVVSRQTALFGASVLLLALMPTRLTAALALALAGAGSIAFVTRANASLQLLADPEKRGRVASLWTIAFIGTTPIGAPLVGLICQRFGARWGLALGGVAAVLSGAYGLMRARETASA